MQYKIRLLVLFALIIALAFSYYQTQRFESLSNLLLDENIELKAKFEKLEVNDLIKKIQILEDENKLLKDQIFQLERQHFLFKSNQNDRYNLEENLKFKDNSKELKDKIDQFEKDNEKDEEYKLTPSIDYDKQKDEIGVKLKIETKF